jgi:hypothetical protein
MKKPSLRKPAPDPVVFEHRRQWGSRLRTELLSIGKSVEWLGTEVGYKKPGSMHQVLNGHHGISRAVFDRILVLVPAMETLPAPPMKKERLGPGARGPHKKHVYPKTGPKAPHLRGRVSR